MLCVTARSAQISKPMQSTSFSHQISPAIYLIFLKIQSLLTKVKYANYLPLYNAQYLHLNFHCLLQLLLPLLTVSIFSLPKMLPFSFHFPSHTHCCSFSVSWPVKPSALQYQQQHHKARSKICASSQFHLMQCSFAAGSSATLQNVLIYR